jgi:hypothetical protein
MGVWGRSPRPFFFLLCGFLSGWNFVNFEFEENQPSQKTEKKTLLLSQQC